MTRGVAGGSLTARRAPEPPRGVLPVSPWPEHVHRGRPASESEETRFRAEMGWLARERGLRGGVRPGRLDSVLVLDALRWAVTARRLVRFLPGADPERLVAAYDLMANRLDRIREAWETLAADPSPPGRGRGAHRWRDLAALGPESVTWWRDVAADPGRWERTVPPMVERYRSLQRAAVAVDGILEVAGRDPVRCRSLASALLDDSTGLWTHELFIPHRVTALAPGKAARLFRDPPAPVRPGI